MSICGGHLKRFPAAERAAAAVEFALILPIFLALLFGIVVFGGYFAVIHSVQQIAAEAARAAIAGLSNAERTALATSNMTVNAPAYPLLAPARLKLVSAATDASGNTFTVTVSYDASDMFIFSLPAIVPVPSSLIVRSAAIQRGGY